MRRVVKKGGSPGYREWSGWMEHYRKVINSKQAKKRKRIEKRALMKQAIET